MNPEPIFSRFLPALCLAVVIASSLHATPICQSSKKKSTPDPYFNPRTNGIQKTDPTNKLSSVSEYVGAFHLTPENIESAVQTSESTPQANISKSIWQPPKTPVAIQNTAPSVGSDDFSPAALTGSRGGATNQDFEIASQPRSTIIRELGVVAKEEASNSKSAANDFVSPTELKRGLGDAGSQIGNTIATFDSSNSSLAANAKSTADAIVGNSKKTFNSSAAKTPLTGSDNAQVGESNKEVFEPTRLLAKVGNEPIFVGDLLFDVNQRVEQFMPNAPEAIKQDAREKLIKQMLPHFVDSKMLFVGTQKMLPEGADIEKILDQAAKEFDDKALPQMMSSTGATSTAEFDGQLRAQGSSLRKMRRSWAKDQLTKYFMSQQLKVDDEITHQEMLDDYRDRIDEYAILGRAKWEQVMIRFDRTSSKAEAEEKIIELRDQIVYGANLAAVAKKESHGFRAPEGGQHDWTSKGSLVLKRLDEKIFTLPVGELSDFFETPDGYHVIRVLERTEATHKPFLEAQVEIKKKMLEEKRSKAFKKHLEKLRNEIPVEYYDDQERVGRTADPSESLNR